MWIKLSTVHKLWARYINSTRRRSLYLRAKSRMIRISAAIVLLFLIYYFAVSKYNNKSYMHAEETNQTQLFEEAAFEDELGDFDKVCEIPPMNPFDPEISKFELNIEPEITCPGFDWVRCHLSRCHVRQEIIDTYKDIKCTYRDIVHKNDRRYMFGPANKVIGNGVYELNISDFVQVKCKGQRYNESLSTIWMGEALGFRPLTSPPAAVDSVNVLMLGFDSTSHHAFIRNMPKSHKLLTAELGSVVLKSYNIVGEGTASALFPILFGMSANNRDEGMMYKWNTKNKKLLDDLPNVFNILKKLGYRTLYFEDMPWEGTFQSKHDGFTKQPADHYLRSFFTENIKHRVWNGMTRYCVGDSPQFLLMINKTKEFFERDGMKFALTFIGDICHDRPYIIGAADDATVDFLRWLKSSGLLENTLVIVFGDHGPRILHLSFTEVRDTYHGKLEERLPFMSIILPHKLKRERPSVFAALAQNTDVLTTPFDVHSTLLDAVGLKSAWNPYQVRGARLLRGLSLLSPIPRNRTCWEAQVGVHWCVCGWDNMSNTDPLYRRSAEVLVASINELTMPHRDLCLVRSLTSIKYVMRRRAYKVNKTKGYPMSNFNQVKFSGEYITLTTTPGEAVYEATLVYWKKNDSFQVNWDAVERTNAYGHEPDCISAINRVLNPFCYCIKKKKK